MMEINESLTIGAVEYEYGAEKMTGSFSRANLACMRVLVWYGAPSSKIIVSSIQPGHSRSSWSMKVLRKRHITSALVFA